MLTAGRSPRAFESIFTQFLAKESPDTTMVERHAPALPPATILAQDGGGLRDDTKKPRYDLIPPEPLDALAMLYGTGADQYGDRNWERGMLWGRVFGPMMRHAWKFWRGEEYDVNEKTGVRTHHLIAVAWNAFTLYTYVVRKAGTDDRSRLALPPKVSPGPVSTSD